MNVLCALLLVLLVRGSPAADISLQISGGKMALPGQFPYQALIGAVDQATGLPDLDNVCAGALIDSRWVLTAASCLSNPHVNYQVTFGAFDLKVDVEDTRVTHTIKNKNIHESYNAATGENDIALLELVASVDESEFVAPIRLPSAKQATQSFWLWNGAVSGWGSTSKGKAPQ
ncbi:prostasin-like [Frankliniella occidentalis]|uniref:Prostasin-like n=1 Tax=Frankliniella occidentalis TaxID=133901 RepID=A0A9C6XCU7_FRAOC|nr:prostasin-like [Frankliniella occidentalis]